MHSGHSMSESAPGRRNDRQQRRKVSGTEKRLSCINVPEMGS